MKRFAIALLLSGCAVFSQVIPLPFPPENLFSPRKEPSFDDLFTVVELGEGKRACVVRRKGYRVGMRFFKSCEEARRKCPIMLFPELMSLSFTMKGVKFPVRIVAVGYGGKEVLNGVFAPETKRIPLPSSTILVIEVPECGAKVRKM